MKIDELISLVQGKCGGAVLGVRKANEKRVYLDLDPGQIVPVARYLFKELGLRFVIASAVDDFTAFEILYHFAHDRGGFVVSVRVILADKAKPVVDTITTVTRSAWWIEREIHELFGIDFAGNEDLRPLLLGDDWPKGVYPMRKDFVPERRDSRKA